MPKQERKYSAPDWKVGDIVYYKWDRDVWWAEREIVGETSRSWLVLYLGASDYMKDPTHYNYPSYCTKLPKSGTSTDRHGNIDHWQAGTKLTMDRAKWVLDNIKGVGAKIQFSVGRVTPHQLLEIAKILELDSVVMTFPEDTNA